MKKLVKGDIGIVLLPLSGATIGMAVGSNLNLAAKTAVIATSTLVGAGSLVAIKSSIDDMARTYSDIEDSVSSIFENAAEVFEDGFSDESFEKVFGE